MALTKSPAGSRPRLIDGNLLFFVGLAAISVGAVMWTKGLDRAFYAVSSGLALLLSIAPMIALGLYLGGLAKELADPEKVAPQLGEKSGWYGLLLATGLGAVTPGGPFAAFPIVYALFLAGADIGAVVAYLTGWSVLALHRVIIWELPLLGPEFAIVRLLASLPLPILAGAIARLLADRFFDVPTPLPNTKSGGGGP
jgi:uncharacterized membrane protein YraQ (UPF0718 family)